MSANGLGGVLVGMGAVMINVATAPILDLEPFLGLLLALVYL